MLLRECESRTKRGLLAKSQQDREEKKNVPVCSKETNSMAEGGSLDHFDKIPNPQILESFHTWEITYTYSRDPCFTTPLKQLDLFASLLIFFVQSLFSLSEDLLQKNYSAGNHRHCSRQTGRKPVHTCSEFCFDNVPD